jgi:hypothetical protein
MEPKDDAEVVAGIRDVVATLVAVKPADVVAN